MSKEETLTQQYIEYMNDYYKEDFEKMISEKFSKEIFNFGQDNYDAANQIGNQ